jgi:hypothetical protein
MLCPYYYETGGFWFAFAKHVRLASLSNFLVEKIPFENRANTNVGAS